MDDPNTPPPAAESVAPRAAPPLPVGWSPRARRWLSLAIAAGGLGVLVGLALLAAPLGFAHVLSVLKPMIGTSLVFVGGLIAVWSYRLLSVSGPDRLHAPRDSKPARGAFFAVWLVGSAIGASITIHSIGSIRPVLTVGTSIGLIVAGTGAVWAFRWIGIKAERAWPAAESSRAIQRPLREWVVFAAFMWGMLSTVFALAVEAVLGVLLGQSVLTELSIVLTAEEANQPNVAANPALVAWLFVSFVFAAPVIEEASKAIGLRYLRSEIRSSMDGLLLGMFIGLGFGFLESALFILNGVGSLGLFVLIWVRLATIVVHCATTGLAGAGYARSRLSGERRARWSGLARAAVTHAIWNAFAVGGVLLLGLLALGTLTLPCLLLFSLPVLIGMAVWMLPRVVRAEIDKSIQEDHAAAGVPLPPEWSPIEGGLWWRVVGGEPEWAPLPTDDAPLSA